MDKFNCVFIYFLFQFGSSSQFTKVDGFGSDFDPFSMSNEPSSGSAYPADSTKTGVESKDQYGDLLGDFGSDRSEQKTNGTDSDQLVATDSLIGVEVGDTQCIEDNSCDVDVKLKIIETSTSETEIRNADL